MASDGKKVTAAKFFVSSKRTILGRMQKLQAKSCAAAVFGRIIRAGVRIIREIEAPKATKGL